MEAQLEKFSRQCFINCPNPIENRATSSQISDRAIRPQFRKACFELNVWNTRDVARFALYNNTGKSLQFTAVGHPWTSS